MDRLVATITFSLFPSVGRDLLFVDRYLPKNSTSLRLFLRPVYMINNRMFDNLHKHIGVLNYLI